MRTSLVSLIVSLFVASTAAAATRANRVRSAVPDATTPGTVCTDMPKLGTQNGPLIQHVKVVDVFYSPGHKYQAMLESFYKAIVQSAYFDWLVEYDEPNYKIGRGSFATTFVDANANPTAVQSLDPEAYLKGLITAKKVPAPDDDTIYMMYFPSGIDPTDGTGPSCIQNGNYCAYHNSYQATGGQMVRYGVIPDMEAGSCAMGCGPAGFDSFTDVSSHELIEAVTDPDGTGWYDVAVPETSQDNCGEIGDICAVGGTMEGTRVAGYFVQNEWSNKNNKCIATDPKVVANDFTLAVTPASVRVPAGGAATVAVALTKTAGMAESVALSATSVAAGLHATFSPASVSSDGGTAMLTIAADATLAAGTMQTITVKATGSVAMPTADVAVAIVAPPPDMASSGVDGTGGTGGNGGRSPGATGGCSVAGHDLAGGWAAAALLLLALAGLRRRA